MGIIENANHIKNVFGEIKNAIEKKGKSVADGTAVGEYAKLIESIATADAPADIFNHGSIAGLNPYYSIYKNLHSSTSQSWKFATDNSYLYSHNSQKSNIQFGCPINKGNYTKLCFDCEVTDGETESNTYCMSYLGIRYCSNGAITDRMDEPDAYAALTNFNNKTNYDGTDPWNTLTRQIVEFDLTQLNDEPFFLMFFSCDCDTNIYSIWLE